MKHTKGPWELLALNSPHHVLVVRSCGKRWHTIAEVFSPDKKGDKEANARLIAAAPELLVSLESIANAGNPTRPTSQEWAVMKALANITIRKAKEK